MLDEMNKAELLELREQLKIDRDSARIGTVYRMALNDGIREVNSQITRLDYEAYKEKKRNPK